MQPEANRGKLLIVRDGYLECPKCRRNRRLMKIPPNAQAHGIVVFCRDCKTEHIVDIFEGQCFESRSQ